MKLVVTFLLLVTSVFARIGENHDELIARFGQPVSQSSYKYPFMERMLEIGPELIFKQNDWIVKCVMIDGRCAYISYQKKDQWTKDQIDKVLSSNDQGVKWTEMTLFPGGSTRSWKRDDGILGYWSELGRVFSIESPTYNHAIEGAKAKAKVEASKMPNI